MKSGTMDELAVKENHEIEQILNNLQDRIRSGRRNKADTSRAEEDFCYAQREYDIRVNRSRLAKIAQ